MDFTTALKRLRDDLKEWTTNNILSLKTYVDKTKFSGSYNDLTNKPEIPSIEGLATEEFVNNAITELREETFPSLTTEDKTLIGAINEVNENIQNIKPPEEEIKKAVIDEILMDVFGITVEDGE